MAATIRKLSSYERRGRSYMRNQPKKASTVAHCTCNAHYGALSIKMMKAHSCLSKCGNEACPYLRKNESHPYWEARRLKKLAKKQAKVTA